MKRIDASGFWNASPNNVNGNNHIFSLLNQIWTTHKIEIWISVVLNRFTSSSRVSCYGLRLKLVTSARTSKNIKTRFCRTPKPIRMDLFVFLSASEIQLNINKWMMEQSQREEREKPEASGLTTDRCPNSLACRRCFESKDSIRWIDIIDGHRSTAYSVYVYQRCSIHSFRGASRK